MNDPDPAARGASVSYRCSGCSRSFVELGDADHDLAHPHDLEIEGSSAQELVCACGAPLVAHALPPGLYDLGAGVTHPHRKARPSHVAIPKESDHGYGASHGYDVTHGGPSGPGDAPADVPDETT
jgi:DNA-directed RNA polymerase subunit RPC12/RpoP